MKASYIIGGLLIVVFIALGAEGWLKSLTPYKSFGEAMASGERVQVKGALLKNKINYDKDGSLILHIRDEAGKDLKVVYQGSKPGNLEQAPQIVAVGAYKDGAFQADQLIVKCPSKYQNESGESR